MKRFINVVPSELNIFKWVSKNKVKIAEKANKIMRYIGIKEIRSAFKIEIASWIINIIRLIKKMRMIRIVRQKAIRENTKEAQFSHQI